MAASISVHAGSVHLFLHLVLGGVFFSPGWLQIRVRYCQVVDCFYVRGCGPEMLDAGCEAFGSREQEVLGEGFVGFRGVGGGLEAFLGSHSC